MHSHERLILIRSFCSDLIIFKREIYRGTAGMLLHAGVVVRCDGAQLFFYFFADL